ncbi:transcriptional regulator, ArsR family [Pseudooceanicola antarcticus]|uniref:ArsR family transcriptional regulator n=1 Tax=Pseudooceanicola antarcticus TaxID=1247613 RepID=A0A285JAA6_9RHOB|nr:metalloregulator ArsR/SmtB family transcription factor [Pseudooceanicola antarcticus]PJE27065.1 ArsR family transcriptional regulator [Pseudooceanicola antarcticus]SNY56336.1 transcriptional regulator, ArsR family [Pseudooceanicola antarcticus]
MDQPQALDALAALANETRLQIVRLLVGRGHDGGCLRHSEAEDAGLAAGAIAQEVSISASRLSFHLNALEQAGLVAAERRGRQVFYRLEHRAMGGLIHYLLNDCCQGNAEVSACCQQGGAPQMRRA